MKKKFCFIVLILAALNMGLAPSAHAGVNRMVNGALRTVGAVFEIPKAMIEDSTRVMFPFGILTGAVRGTLKTVTGVIGGAAQMATGAAPYAKYLLLV